MGSIFTAPKRTVVVDELFKASILISLKHEFCRSLKTKEGKIVYEFLYTPGVVDDLMGIEVGNIRIPIWEEELRASLEVDSDYVW